MNQETRFTTWLVFYTECFFAEYHFSECHFAESQLAIFLSAILFKDWHSVESLFAEFRFTQDHFAQCCSVRMLVQRLGCNICVCVCFYVFICVFVCVYLCICVCACVINFNRLPDPWQSRRQCRHEVRTLTKCSPPEMLDLD